MAVNFSTYGAVGDGITNDTTALRNALDAESDLISDAGATFLISGRLDIDQNGTQTIDWNGATVITTGSNEMFWVEKPSGRLTMSNLTVDGGGTSSVGFRAIFSLVTFNNINVTNFYSSTQTAYAFRVEIGESTYNNDEGDFIFDGCDCDEMNGDSPGSIGDTTGTTRCLIFRWMVIPTTTTTVTFKNSIFSECWGDDGDLVQIEDKVGGIGGSASRWVFDNMIFRDYSRRGIKGTSGGISYLNSTFIAPDINNPKLKPSNTPAALFTAGNFIQNQEASGILVENCTFDGTLGGEDLVIVSRADGISFNNCEWIGGADLRMQQVVGDVDVCSCIFGAGSFILESNQTPVDVGEIRLDTGNTYVEANPINLSLYSYIEVPLNCPPLSGTGDTPVVTLDGASVIELTVGDTYVELGATWTDTEDGSGAATVSGDTIPVPTNTVTSYTKNYNYTDTDGNVATEVSRTINVSAAVSEDLIQIKEFLLGSSKSSTAYIGSTKTITE